MAKNTTTPKRPPMNTSMKRALHERITAFLRENGPTKARRIAKALREEKADVNRVLYIGSGVGRKVRAPYAMDPETFTFMLDTDPAAAAIVSDAA